MNSTYYATCGTDLVHADDDLRALLDWLGDVHEAGDWIVVWRDAAVILVIDGAGHTIYVSDPEGQR
jgi:hypothetical protein